MQSSEAFLPLLAVSLVICLSAIFIHRGLYREFPFFFSYLSCSILATAARLMVGSNYRTFFIVYWITEAAYATLALLALHEVFRRVFAAFYLFWWFRLIFPAAIIVVALFTFKAVMRPPAAAPQALRLILLFSLVAKYIQAWLFAVFFVLVVLFGLAWRTYTFGIVQGFAVSALGTWIASMGRSEFGIKFAALTRYGPAVAYILAVIVWLAMFWRPERPAVTEEWTRFVTPSELAAEIKQSTELLWRFIWKP